MQETETLTRGCMPNGGHESGPSEIGGVALAPQRTVRLGGMVRPLLLGALITQTSETPAGTRSSRVVREEGEKGIGQMRPASCGFHSLHCYFWLLV
jgi:hypothetical protein